MQPEEASSLLVTENHEDAFEAGSPREERPRWRLAAGLAASAALLAFLGAALASRTSVPEQPASSRSLETVVADEQGWQTAAAQPVAVAQTPMATAVVPAPGIDRVSASLVAQEQQQFHTVPVQGAVWHINDKLMIASQTGRNRVCTVVNVDPLGKRVKVHYDGFPDAFDEWMDQSSERILGVAVTSTSTTLTTTSSTRTSTTHTETSTTSTTRTFTTTTATTSTTTTITTTTTTTPRRYVSLFCFTLARSYGFEIDITRLQLAKGTGIFDCDETVVFSDVRTWISQGPTYLVNPDGTKPEILIETVDIGMKLSPYIDKLALVNGDEAALQNVAASWRNAPHLVECWRRLLEDGRYKFHDWVVKVDPDAAFFPARLRARLAKPPFVASTSESAYLRTCGVTPHRCVWSITLSRAYGTDWTTKVIGESSDSFTIGGCDATSKAGKECVNGGWGTGINVIVNQRGETVGLANCCSEDNHVIAQTAQCPQTQKPKGHQGISGALEAFTSKAVDLYGMQGTRCLLDTSYKTWGEEYFLQECMDYLGAKPLDGTSLLRDKYCNGDPTDCTSSEVAFHPIADTPQYMHCAAQAFEDLATVELHSDLLKATEAEG